MTVQTTAVTYQNFINNQWVNSTSEDLISSLNPANRNEIVGYIQNSTEEDVDRAVEAAKKAKKGWRKLSGAERGNYLYKIASVMEERHKEIAETLTKEMGKTLLEAKGETSRGIAILRYFAGEGMRDTGDVIPASDSKALMYTNRVPLGVAGIITPWNFPVAIPIWKMAPALIYGNTVVIKPAQEAAITAAKIIECMEEAGVPEGVVNLVTGRGSIVGQRIIEHTGVNGLTFTGSNKVGKSVAEGAVARGAKFQLEMGGKNPIIVADDADLEQAVEATISGGLRSTGQKCTATSRVIVQEGIYEQFRERLLERTREITVGDGMKDHVWMGPCVNENQLNTVLSYIETGKEEGATLSLGGERPRDPELENGFYVEPTIFEDVNQDMTIAQEEIFGPVLALMKVDTIEKALEMANDVTFGLSASIFTKNIDNMFEFIDEVEAGLVRVNFETAGVELQAPFGGMKDSSSGSREQGTAAKEFFTSIKTVYVKP
ncbi:alpha-ketoglutaric semialdehyde dehydrogenase GucD [Halobacillus naozhouensis]|uniref:Aldehyde dehydrogenase family protein n=1 Tax=Halobacillus naozhouensis TaxID=554880 RepID=A0ABY8IY52_9BACI|nr:alpha-ketoglutaric semialdehyde dehydrogenase GucD [Halobacillus naozhouensis]WFT74109.1 aldehyde dehydrogenase family protein [Halobacillus naozhouensis]